MIRSTHVAIALALLALAAWSVWPTPWAYRTEYQESKAMVDVPVLTRTNRFTGQKQTEYDDGWHDGSIVID